MKKEKERVGHYLHISSEQKLLEVCLRIPFSSFQSLHVDECLYLHLRYVLTDLYLDCHIDVS